MLLWGWGVPGFTYLGEICRAISYYWPTMFYSHVATLKVIIGFTYLAHDVLFSSNLAWINLNDSNISQDVQGHNPSSSGADLEV
jgi:hypothetical protein